MDWAELLPTLLRCRSSSQAAAEASAILARTLQGLLPEEAAGPLVELLGGQQGHGGCLGCRAMDGEAWDGPQLRSG